LYEDTTILETHATCEGLVPRRHVNHWDDNVTDVYRKTAMEVTKQSHGRKKGSRAWSGKIGTVTKQYQKSGKNDPFRIQRNEISERQM
jgi:hypothetical protein